MIVKFTSPNGDAWQINLDHIAYVNWPAPEAGLDAPTAVAPANDAGAGERLRARAAGPRDT
jgi:hypothetical protein